MMLLVTGLMAVPAPGGAQDATATELRERLSQLRQHGSISISGEMVYRSSVIADLYDRAAFAPLWTDLDAAHELSRAIAEARADGLDPADYHLGTIEALAAAPATPGARADLDILRSDALLRLAHDLRYGKVDQTDPTAGRNLSRPLTGTDGAEDLRRVIASGRVYEELGRLRPSHYAYSGLMAALADLRRIEERGGWEPIAAGPALRAGNVDARVRSLRKRLVPGDLSEAYVPDEDAFDAVLEAAVKSFQHRHGFNEDGVVGPVTLAELNVPVARRIEQIRVNLERARWVTHDLPDSYVAVNIAGARVYLVRDGAVVHEARAIVGRTSTRTPIFRASMRYIELNPTWTVPPGIVGEILAEVRRDPDYLKRNDMQVLDRSGRPVQVSAAELGRYSAQGFPYVFRQQPGPANPLGRIKFVFPNSHHVYLHDTPAKHLFDREQRTFSHGCIRVEDPFRLAELLLNDSVLWSRTALLAATEDGRTRTLPLPRPVPVLVLYWTASTDLHGELHFYRDVYGRDAALLQALNRR